MVLRTGPLRLTHEYGSFSSQSLRSHALLEKRNGLLVDFLASEATGTAERDAASALLDEARERGFHLVNHQEL